MRRRSSAQTSKLIAKKDTISSGEDEASTKERSLSLKDDIEKTSVRIFRPVLGIYISEPL